MMSSRSRYPDNIRRVSVHSTRRTSADNIGRVAHERGNELAAKVDEADGHVQVAVRCRPMSAKERAAGYESIVDFESDKRIVVHDVGETPSEQLGTKSGERRNISRVYDFDRVLDMNASQDEVYDSVCRPIVEGALEGYNGTIFAYGQTGTGKTYTMEGQPYANGAASKGPKNASPEQAPGSAEQASALRGVIPRTFEQVFEHIARHPETRFLVRASYLEIYQEEIRDLLLRKRGQERDTNKKSLELHERPDIGVYVKDLTSFVCKSKGDIERVMRVGNQNRIVGATDMNERSSRSHAIFMITIEQQQIETEFKLKRADGPTKSRQADELDNNNSNGSSGSSKNFALGRGPTGGLGATSEGARKIGSIRVGKLNLVDLAGSERQRKTNTLGQRQKESIKINLSLSALGNVINSLLRIQQQPQVGVRAAPDNNKDARDETSAASGPAFHTPYRDSKLTRLLQDSLGGNARTLMIANIGPASYNHDETINTLNYASRARCICNKPRLNEDPKDALLRQLQLEIEWLRAKLAERIGGDKAQADAFGHTWRTLARSAVGGGGGGGESEHSSGVSSANSNQSATTSASVDAAFGTSRGERLAEQKAAGQVERELLELRQKLASLESKLLNGGERRAATVAALAGLANDDHGMGVAPRQEQEEQGHELEARQMGGDLLKGFTREQERELEQRQHELASQAGRERAIRNELERREEAELLAKQSFGSIQQEVEAKRRLIKQVLLKVKSVRDAIESYQETWRVELNELESLQADLQRELKLKCLIMDNFVPNAHVDQLLARVVYDGKRNLCYIEPMSAIHSNECPGSGLQMCPLEREPLESYWRPTYDSIRPRSEFERISEAIYPNNVRYKYEHLLEPKLELFSLDARQHRRARDRERQPGGAPDGQREEALARVAGGGLSLKLADKLRAAGLTAQSDSDVPPSDLCARVNAALDRREPDIVI